MSNLPYTDDDLRAEAARQHYVLTSQLNSREVLGRMLDARVQSTCSADAADGLTWDEALNCGEFDEPKQAVVGLIRGAADVSEWAVDIGADGLEPLDAVLSMQTTTGPLVRIHFAVRPDMPDEMRLALVEGLGMEIAKYLPQTT